MRLSPAGPIEIGEVDVAAGGDTAFFFAGLFFFFVGEASRATFRYVGDKGVAFVVCRHIGFFAVEVAGCVVVAAVWAGSAAGGVGGPEVGVYVGGALGGLAAK